MKEYKEYEEYMASLTEQVHDVRAKRLVSVEIQNHIEEQAEDYEADGMTREDAIKAAVRQMGNPIETGTALNKIHRPRMPWAMICMVIVMMLAAIVMQAVIFLAGGNVSSSWATIPKTIVYNVVGLCVILGLLYWDYNFIAKYAYALYAAYIMGIPLFRLVVRGFAEVGHVTESTAYYGIQMLFPIIFAGVVYRNRNRSWRGIWMCLLLGMAGTIWGSMMLGAANGNHYRYSAVAETLLIVGVILVLAFCKNIFGIERRKRWISFSLGIFMLVACVAVCVFCGLGGGPRNYLWMRMVNVFTGDEVGYMNLLLRESIVQADWIGGETFLQGKPNSESYGLFVLNSIFTYFGKLAGVLVIAVYIGFLVMALRMSLKQSNRIGMLVGTACTISILVRFIAYLACNFGFGLWWTTLVPFLSYGRVSAIMNGIYVGLILCVYRNSRILAEENIPQKPMKRIRIVVE